jgi:hypothetical protein
MSTPVAGLAVQTPASPGVPVNAIGPNQAGGYIVNPLAAVDQGLPSAEVLFVSQVGPADTSANNVTVALQPGQSYTVIPNTTTPVSVASGSANHKFTAVQWP